MSTIVSASVSAVPLNNKKVDNYSSFNEYSTYLRMLDVDYITYRNQDYSRGYTKEISSSYYEGRYTPLQPIVKNVTATSIIGVNSYFTEEITEDDTVYSSDVSYNVFSSTNNIKVDLMPIGEILSDYHENGLLEDTTDYGNKNRKLIKKLHVDEEEVVNQFRELEDIPKITDRLWKPYHDAYINDNEGTNSEQEYRDKLVENLEDRRKSNKDVTDVSVGYFGRFDSDSHIMPFSMFHTYLEILKGTTLQEFVIKEEETTKDNDGNTVITKEAVIDKVRKFSVQNNLFYSVYTMSGYILSEYNGTLSDKYIYGYSNVSVHLEEDDKFKPIGKILHSDFTNNDYYIYRQLEEEDNIYTLGYDSGSSYTMMPKLYVTIDVQVSSEKIQRLVLFDLFQETTITGKGRVRIGSSAEQTSGETNLSFIEAYCKESFIPLSYSSMKKVHIFQRGSLIWESKSLLVQIVNVTHTKWWKKWIPIILKVASIVVFVFSLGSATTLSGLLWSIATQIAVQMAIRYTIKELVKLGIINGDLASTLAVVVAVVATAYGGIDMSLSSSLSLSIEATGTMYQEVSIINSNEFKRKLSELKKESEEYEKLINEYESTGNTTMLLLMLDVVRYIDSNVVVLDKSPSEFFSRTLDRRPVYDINNIRNRDV